MKKIIAWALTLILCLCAIHVLAEEPAGETEIPEDIQRELEAALAEYEAQREEEIEPSPLGEWYAMDQGLAVTLTLREDGSYTLVYPVFPEETEEGAWTLEDGFVQLDMDEDALFSFDEDRLACYWLGLSFTREPVEAYVPAALVPDASLDMYEGAWMTEYTLADGAALPLAWHEEDARVYVERNRVAVAGSRFGEIIVDCAFENGALIYTGQGLSLRLEMQEDDLLRMTAVLNGEETTMILTWFLPDALRLENTGE